jgi:hypothetical protein
MARRTGSRRARGRKQGAGRERGSSAARATAAQTAGSSGRVAAARERIVRSMLAPLNAVLLTRKSIEEVLDDAVMRGRMTRSDAQEMIQSLFSRGAKATDDFLADVERLLGGRTGAIVEAEPPLVGPNLPIPDYDELSAAQVQERLDGLTPAELRKLREYEQRHANRKTVLDRIERRLR